MAACKGETVLASNIKKTQVQGNMERCGRKHLELMTRSPRLPSTVSRTVLGRGTRSSTGQNHIRKGLGEKLKDKERSPSGMEALRPTHIGELKTSVNKIKQKKERKKERKKRTQGNIGGEKKSTQQ